MSILSLNMDKIAKNKKIIILAAVLILAILPVLTLSSHKKYIYVDANASGTQNGSSSHPYKTIGAAMQKADKNTEIHIRKGTYKENVEIKDGVEIYGGDAEKVIIKADDDDDATVVMNHKSKINKVTIKGGKNGIWVEKDAKASIINCIIKDNEKNGIAIEADGIKDSRAVYIDGNIIKKNGANGIWAGKRRISVTENEIKENGADGLVIAQGSKAWVANNSIRDNRFSGIKMTIDGSNIWTKNNSIRYNGREGIEVAFYGHLGRVNIAKSKIVENGRWAIARVQRASFAGSYNLWNQNLTFDNRNEYWGNRFGNISPIFLIK